MEEAVEWETCGMDGGALIFGVTYSTTLFHSTVNTLYAFGL